MNGELETQEFSLSSGSFLPTGFGFVTIFPQYSLMTLAVGGHDDDCDFFEACGSRGPPIDFSSGSNHQSDWATAMSGNISIPKLGPTNVNFVSRQVTFQTTGNRLEFKVFATINVRYGVFRTS